MTEREGEVLEFHLPEGHRARAGTDTALLAAGFATMTALVVPHALATDLAPFLCVAEEHLASVGTRRVSA